MLCEQIWGKLPDFDLSGKTVEYVDIEWHEAFKKIHKKTTDHGTEIGNRHAPLFWGEDDTFITIYNEPMLIMLQKIHGVTAVKEVKKLDFDQRISASIHDHHHFGRMGRPLFAGRLIPYLMIFRRLFMSELNFYLLQINDALFPIGAYSHSQGLET